MKKVNVRTETKFGLTLGYPTGWFENDEIELVGYANSYSGSTDSILAQAMGIEIPSKITAKATPSHVTATGTWGGKQYAIQFDTWWYINAVPNTEVLRKALEDHCSFVEVPEDMFSSVALMRDILITFWVR